MSLGITYSSGRIATIAFEANSGWAAQAFTSGHDSHGIVLITLRKHCASTLIREPLLSIAELTSCSVREPECRMPHRAESHSSGQANLQLAHGHRELGSSCSDQSTLGSVESYDDICHRVMHIMTAKHL